MVGAICGILALLGAGLNFTQTNNLSQRTPGITAIQDEVTLDSRAQFFAQNFFTLWITGTEADSPAVSSFYDAIPLNDFNTRPFSIVDLNVANKKVTQPANGDRMWTFTFGVTVQTAGAVQPSRMYYDVDVVQKDKSFKIVKLPVAVNYTNQTIAAQTAYPNRISENTPLYQLAVNYAATYLTSAGSGSFGRYITAGYVGEPLANSPYTAADVRGVFMSGNTSESTAEPNTPVDVLIRVRASTSQATYVHMDLAVKAVKQENGQWLIDGLVDPVVGAVNKTQ